MKRFWVIEGLFYGAIILLALFLLSLQPKDFMTVQISPIMVDNKISISYTRQIKRDFSASWRVETTRKKDGKEYCTGGAISLYEPSDSGVHEWDLRYFSGAKEGKGPSSICDLPDGVYITAVRYTIHFLPFWTLSFKETTKQYEVKDGQILG